VAQRAAAEPAAAVRGRHAVEPGELVDEVLVPLLRRHGASFPCPARAAAVGASAGRKASSLSSETVTSVAVAKLVIVVIRRSSPRVVRSSSGTAKPRWPGGSRAGGT